MSFRKSKGFSFQMTRWIMTRILWSFYIKIWWKRLCWREFAFKIFSKFYNDKLYFEYFTINYFNFDYLSLENYLHCKDEIVVVIILFIAKLIDQKSQIFLNEFWVSMAFKYVTFRLYIFVFLRFFDRFLSSFES